MGPARTARSRGVEAVIDKDFASELLAREIDADLFVMATDVDAVYEGWGTADQRRLSEVTVAELRAHSFAGRVDGPEGRSGGPVRRGDRQAGRHRALEDIEAIVGGTAGTNVVAERTT